jgi:uncharacterized protein (DUF1684 family)
MRRLLALTLLFLLVAIALSADSYGDSVEQWRQNRETRLRSDSGWLTVAGLFWLKEGNQTIGSDASSNIQLPAHSAPGHLGEIEFRQGQATLHYEDHSKGSVALAPDSSGSPTRIEFGEITFWVIQRGERYGIRLQDRQSEIRKSFTGCKWYPVNADFRITARFVPDPKKIRIPSIIGVTNEEESPGYVEFERNGETIRLRPTGDEKSLSFILRDGTSGRSTYGAGRFLDTDGPIDGKVILDFNLAYNPPCAFTPYATCPLPPKENRFRVPIEAGEKTYAEH